METKKKKKLLIASDCFLPRWDGVARFLAEIIPRIKDDYDITVVVPDFRGAAMKFHGFNVVRIPVMKFRWGDYSPPRFRRAIMKRLVRENDIIFSQSLGPIGALSVVYAKRYRKPVASFIHCIEWELVPKSASTSLFVLKYIVKAYARYLYNKTSFLIVPSDDTAQMLKDAGIHRTMRVAHLGVDVEKFHPAKDKADAKRKAGLDPDDTIIGYSGRIGREKNLKTLYRAFREVQQSCGSINGLSLKLLIVGKGLELKDKFESMTDVIHVPVSNNVQDHLNAMDIFVLPSLVETTSLATMEAMACGLPVIATDVGYTKYYIRDGKNGYIFSARDHKALSRKLEHLIRNPPLRKAIGAMARKTIESEHRFNRTVSEIKRCLAEL